MQPALLLLAAMLVSQSPGRWKDIFQVKICKLFNFPQAGIQTHARFSASN